MLRCSLAPQVAGVMRDAYAVRDTCDMSPEHVSRKKVRRRKARDTCDTCDTCIEISRITRVTRMTPYAPTLRYGMKHRRDNAAEYLAAKLKALREGLQAKNAGGTKVLKTLNTLKAFFHAHARLSFVWSPSVFCEQNYTCSALLKYNTYKYSSQYLD